MKNLLLTAALGFGLIAGASSARAGGDDRYDRPERREVVYRGRECEPEREVIVRHVYVEREPVVVYHRPVYVERPFFYGPRFYRNHRPGVSFFFRF